MPRVANTQKIDKVDTCRFRGRGVPPKRVPRSGANENLQLKFVGGHVARQAVGGADRRTKRMFDVVVGAVLLLVMAPLLVLVALLVAMTFRAPIVGWKLRPGIGGRPIRLYEFRTRHATHNKTGRLLKSDQRDTSLGRFLRASKLAKLPHLFSLLRGELSLVGPRALPPSEDMIGVDVCSGAKPGLISMGPRMRRTTAGT